MQHATYTPSHKDSPQPAWNLALVAGVLTFMGVLIICIIYGAINSDEGWYLYASKLVYQGQRPYQDFAYTQTPLLPYIYGLPQLLFPGVLTGRLTSAALTLTGVLVGAYLADQYGGRKAAALSLFLSAIFLYGVYHVTIVKTYSLVLLFFMLTWLALFHKKYFLAATLSVLAIYARLSALPFAAIICLYCLYHLPDWRKRGLFFALMAGLAAPMLLFVFPQPMNLRWNLTGHHLSQWEGKEAAISFSGMLNEVFVVRMPLFMLFYLPRIGSLTIIGILLLDNRQARRRVRQAEEVMAVFVGLVGFTIVHFVTGGFHLNYFAPSMLTVTPIIAWGMLYIFTVSANRSLRVVMAFLSVLWIVWGFSTGLQSITNISQIAQIQQAQHIFEETVTPDQTIFVLEPLWLLVETERDPLPNLTMAQFSYEPRYSIKEAEQQRLVNSEMVQAYLDTADVLLVQTWEYELEPYLTSVSFDSDEFDRVEVRPPDASAEGPRIDIYVRK